MSAWSPGYWRTLPSVKRLRLMFPVSCSDGPALPLYLRRSLPARSTKHSRPCLNRRTRQTSAAASREQAPQSFRSF